jgi:hypothetical protein
MYTRCHVIRIKFGGRNNFNTVQVKETPNVVETAILCLAASKRDRLWLAVWPAELWGSQKGIFLFRHETKFRFCQGHVSFRRNFVKNSAKLNEILLHKYIHIVYVYSYVRYIYMFKNVYMFAHVRVRTRPCRMSTLHVHATCKFCTSTMHVLAAFPCCMLTSMLHVQAGWIWNANLHVLASCPNLETLSR